MIDWQVRVNVLGVGVNATSLDEVAAQLIEAGRGASRGMSAQSKPVVILTDFY